MQIPSKFVYRDCDSFCWLGQQAIIGTLWALEYLGKPDLWQVYVNPNHAKGYRKTIRLCRGHHQELYADYQEIVQLEVDVYEASLTYYIRTEDCGASTEAR